MEITRHQDGTVYARMDDDGRRHEVFCVPWRYGSFQALGAVNDGWLVVDGLTRLAWMFQGEGEFLHWRYVGEKFDCRERRARALTMLICAATGRLGSGVTNEPAPITSGEG